MLLLLVEPYLKDAGEQGLKQTIFVYEYLTATKTHSLYTSVIYQEYGEEIKVNSHLINRISDLA